MRFSQFILLSVLVAIAIIPLFFMALKAGSLNNVFSFFLSRFIGLLLSLRYRIQIRGIDCIPKNKGGVLFLPNHPAEIDPIILGARLWKSFRPRPVVLETFYHMPLANRIMKIMRAFPMPDMTSGTGSTKNDALIKLSWAYRRLWIMAILSLMYPSGKLMRSSLELLGAASGVKRALESCENIQIVLVRTRGVMGKLLFDSPNRWKNSRSYSSFTSWILGSS